MPINFGFGNGISGGAGLGVDSSGRSQLYRDAQSDMVDYGPLGELIEQNQLAQELAAQKQREFEQSSAREAMTFEAEQAALNRAYQTSSAREAMTFEAEQAALNRAYQTSSAREAMTFEAEQAALNRDWQEHMSNTAYQRAMQDLQAAGLNPALAYQQGGAASTAGATAAGHAASGSSASGYMAHGSKADVDASTAKDLITMIVNAAADIHKTNAQTLTGILSALGEIIPG